MAEREKSDWGKQDGNMCPPCVMAGMIYGDYVKDKVPFTPERKRGLDELHSQCPGKSRCFCQHRVPESKIPPLVADSSD